MTTRVALFQAIRAFAPDRRFTEDHVKAIDALANSFGLASLATPPDARVIVRTLKTPSEFFASVRDSFGALSQEQVDGFNALLKAMAEWPVTWAAYGLATAWHETAHRMQPIRERGGHAYLDKYDTGRLAAALGNTPADDDDGQKYGGRGYVQITGRKNYEAFGIADSPDDALDPEIAARILLEGMERGVFTGKKLSDYLPGDYVGARRIINGSDKAELIAGHARAFQAALINGGWS